MAHRLFIRFGLASIVLACAFTPSTARAQAGFGINFGKYPYGPGWYGPRGYGPGWNGSPWNGVNPRAWNYAGLGGGPYMTNMYPFAGWPGYRGAFGSFWTNGLSLYGPPVPVYGPIPGVFGNGDLVRQWHARPTLGLGFGYYGWVGPFAASPRPKTLAVNPWPRLESIPAAGQLATAQAAPAGAAPGTCLYMSVKVPQPAAEVFVDGMATAQTGTDRLYESPPLDAGKDYRYELTARWVSGGVTYEKKKLVTGRAGEVVRVDFMAPDVVVPTGK